MKIYITTVSFFIIYDSGKGAGNFPGLWGCICCTAFDCYDKNSHREKFSSPDWTITYMVHMIGFINNASGYTNDFDSLVLLPITHYAEITEKDTQVWDNVIHLTGAALNKIFVSLLVFFAYNERS